MNNNEVTSERLYYVRIFVEYYEYIRRRLLIALCTLMSECYEASDLGNLLRHALTML